MSDDRREYVIDIAGVPHTVLLDDASLASYPSAVPVKGGPAPKNKARTPANKAKAEEKAVE